MVIAHPGQDVELLCAVTSSNIQSVSWIINYTRTYEVSALHNGTLTGYSSNGSSLIVKDIMMNDVRNGSNFSCVINITTAIRHSTILYVAGEYQYTWIYVCSMYIRMVHTYIRTCM